jgi:hypothetical protein
VFDLFVLAENRRPLLIVLPTRGLVNFFGFKHDRKQALKALSLAATKEDVHGVFAGSVKVLDADTNH